MEKITIYKYSAAVGSGFDGMVSFDPSPDYAEAIDKNLGEFYIPANLTLTEDVKGKFLIDSDGREYELKAQKGGIYAVWDLSDEFRYLLKKVS